MPPRRKRGSGRPQPAQVSYPLPPLGGPFVYRAGVKPIGEAAATVQSTTEPAGADHQVTVTVVPRKPWSTVTLVLPAGVRPVDSSVAGVVRGERWQASFTAPPAGGAVFRLRLRAADVALLSDARVVIQTAGLPGAADFPGLPSWLPREHSAWSARSIVVLAIPDAHNGVSSRWRAGVAPTCDPTRKCHLVDRFTRI